MSPDPSDPTDRPRAGRRPGSAPRIRVPDNVQWGPPAAAPEPAPRAAVQVAQPAARPSPASVQLPGRKPPPPGPSLAPEVEVEPEPAGPLYVPQQPRSWADAGLDRGVVQQLVLRYLLGTTRVPSKRVADAIAVALPMVREVSHGLKDAKLVTYVGTNVVGDFICELTAKGRDKALQAREQTSYVGPAPVVWEDYQASVEAQTLKRVHPGPADLARAFSDLAVSEDLLDGLGPAITSCQPMFLHGEPGNGKTSIAERITACYGDSIWIPYTLSLGGVLIKLFDPAIHEQVPYEGSDKRIDKRWVHIKRPTVIAGGELTLDMLEIALDEVTNVCESPLQLKANCGTLVIDDFGRGKTSPTDLLNRWIFPLERRIDFLSLPDGRKLAVPFECMLVFSTNLQPRDLADEAFLRRIPYKVHVGDPDEFEYAELMAKLADKMGVRLTERSVKYLVERHYKMEERPMRFCHPRDLLQQIVHLARYRGEEPKAGPEEWDKVVRNYFGLV